MSDSLQPHELQHARPPCPSPTPGVCPNSCPLSHWCHPTISSSVVPFSFCLQSFPSSGAFQMSQFFTSWGQSIRVSTSTSVLPMNIKDWFRLRCTGWISLQSKGLSRIFSNTTVQKQQFFSAQLSLWSNSHSHTTRIWSNSHIHTTVQLDCQFSSVQFSRSVVSDSLRSHDSQHARPPCSSPSPRVHSDSRPSSPWCHPPSHPQSSLSPPAPNPSQHQSLFQGVNSSHEVSKVLEFQC